jgi:hypothetical protein
MRKLGQKKDFNARAIGTGGTPLALCEKKSGRGAIWTTDLRIVFGAAGALGLLQVPASGGSPIPMTKLDPSLGEQRHFHPQLLPGGRFLYWARSNHPGVYAASLEKPQDRVRLLDSTSAALYAEAPGAEGYIFFERSHALMAQRFEPRSLKLLGAPWPIAAPVAAVNGFIDADVSSAGLLAYSTPDSELYQMIWFDRSGRRLGILGEPGRYGSMRLSHQGDRLAIVRAKDTYDEIWLLDIERAIATPFAPGDNTGPVWSPDSSVLVYSTGDPLNVQLKPLSGSVSAKAITNFPHIAIAMDWSRDGRSLLLAEGVTLNIVETGQAGGIPIPLRHRVFLNREGFFQAARFSPEATPRWVAFSSRYEIYVTSFPDARGKWQISTSGGQCPAWSPDGNEIYYVSSRNKLTAVEVKSQNDRIAVSPPRELFDIKVTGRVCPYDVAPDGKRFLVRVPLEKQTQQRLRIIVNWPALLRNHTPSD